MPRSASGPCRYPGCTALGTSRGYCPTHAAARERERGTPTQRGYTAGWRRIRARFLVMNPLCADCRERGRYTVATEVHHLVPLRDGGTHEDGNLAALCKRCHSRRTASGE
jgi:5-methylcytosine-specific restriction enzyme A